MKVISSDKDEILARIVVEGVAATTDLPRDSDLPRCADNLPITDAELTAMAKQLIE